MHTFFCDSHHSHAKCYVFYVKTRFTVKTHMFLNDLCYFCIVFFKKVLKTMKSDAEIDAKSGVGQPRLEMGPFYKEL